MADYRDLLRTLNKALADWDRHIGSNCQPCGAWERRRKRGPGNGNGHGPPLCPVGLRIVNRILRLLL